MAKTVDLVVDERVLFDIHILPGDIRLGLIVIVIGDEELDRVVGKELAELGAKLCRKGLIVCEDEGGTVAFCADVCHCKGLTRARNAEEGLHTVAAVDAVDELLDRLGLIACGLIFRYESKALHARSLLLFYTNSYTPYIVPQNIVIVKRISKTSTIFCGFFRRLFGGGPRAYFFVSPLDFLADFLYNGTVKNTKGTGRL